MGIHSFGSAEYILDAAATHTTTNTAAYQTALNLTSDVGGALVISWIDAGDASDINYLKVTIDGNVVLTDVENQRRGAPLATFYSFNTSFKVEHKTGNVANASSVKVAYCTY